VRALAALAERGGRVKGSQLAATLDASPGFVAQVLNPLVRRGWVRSEPGPTGGYSLTVEPSRVSVLDVIEAIEGPTDTGRCVLVDRLCDQGGTCALHASWVPARSHLLRELARTTVVEVAP
jgi:Rrf2 family protein